MHVIISHELVALQRKTRIADILVIGVSRLCSSKEEKNPAQTSMEIHRPTNLSELCVGFPSQPFSQLPWSWKGCRT